jgi:TPR repeat protein
MYEILTVVATSLALTACAPTRCPPYTPAAHARFNSINLKQGAHDYQKGVQCAEAKTVSTHLVTSEQWIRLAAHQGDAKAQYKYALMYITATNKRLDRKRGMYWLKKSAAQGYKPAVRLMKSA